MNAREQNRHADHLAAELQEAKRNHHTMVGPEIAPISHDSALRREFHLAYSYSRAFIYRCECGAFIMLGHREDDGRTIPVANLHDIRCDRYRHPEASY